MDLIQDIQPDSFNSFVGINQPSFLQLNKAALNQQNNTDMTLEEFMDPFDYSAPQIDKPMNEYLTNATDMSRRFQLESENRLKDLKRN